MVPEVSIDGAGEGNRTLVVSLGSCCSTIELHPQRAAWAERALATHQNSGQLLLTCLNKEMVNCRIEFREPQESFERPWSQWQ